MTTLSEKYGRQTNGLPWALHVIFMCVLIGVIYTVFYQQFLGLVEWWRMSSKYGHIIVVLPVVAYQIYRQKTDLFNEAPTVDIWATAVFAATLFGLIAAIIASVDVIAQTAMLALIPIVAWMILGRSVAYLLGFSIFLLMTAAPLWELVTPFLTELTTKVSNGLLSQFGVPVYRNGAYLTIPEGTFEIAHGCGGFRYFIVGMTLGILVAIYNFRHFRARVLVILIAVMLALLGNWIRVIAVIWAGHVSEMQHVWVDEHVNLGWWIFLGVFMPFFIVTGRYSSANVASQVDPLQPRVAPRLRLSPMLPLTLIGSLSLVGFSQYLVNRLSGEHPFVMQLSDLKELQIDGWQGPYPYNGAWKPHFSGAQFQQTLKYARQGLTANVHVVGYRSQSPGNELINIYSNFVNANWRDLGSETHSVALSNRALAKINQQSFTKGRESGSIWYWYDVGGFQTANATYAKLLEVSKIFKGNYYSFAIGIHLKESASRHGDLEKSQAEFVSEYYLQISTLLAEAHLKMKR